VHRPTNQPRRLAELVLNSAELHSTARAISSERRTLNYEELSIAVLRSTAGLTGIGLRRYDRLGIYLPKSIENVVSLLATSHAGGVFVPINPVLKADQVAHILRDCAARFLVTNTQRLATLSGQLATLPQLAAVILIDADAELPNIEGKAVYRWSEVQAEPSTFSPGVLEDDMTAIFYTSGSTGKPKGVVLSHRNIVTGALSVAQYLENDPNDRILSLLPLSFDAGFSQLTTAFSVGASVVLLDYLLPRDVVRACEREAITGVTGVPPLWMQLIEQPWTPASTQHVRYFANTGGKMPREILAKLCSTFTNAKPYLMYGLTEAFRSTYLPPEEAKRRPDSIGKAIPNVEIQVVRPDGTLCDVDEPGELVHRGPLVSLGYWNDLEKTAERFRPAPGQPKGLPFPEIAVWSGDTVKLDTDGFLYFIGRKDDMIKTSGYRVSPTEIEESAFESGLVSEAVAIGVAHDTLGQMIVVLAKPTDPATSIEQLTNWYRQKLPLYMVPHRIEWRDALPRNPNGKIDRVNVRALLANDETKAPV
jgi:acyl-CoA ligase (AMP-forming) (exosortase A-associated)